MYNRLIRYLKDDLKTFDREDCAKVKLILAYLKNHKNIPLKIIKEKSFEYYQGYSLAQGIEPLDEWSFYLCKTELTWEE